MYVSDRKVSNILAFVVLFLGPWLGSTQKSWGWLLDATLLLAVFLVGRNNKEKGLKQSSLLLFFGYSIAVVSQGTLSLQNMSFIPLAALITLWGLEKEWPQRDTVLASLVAVGILSLIPVFTLLAQGIPQENLSSLISQVMEQYRQTGMLETFQQQGMNESEVNALLQEVINMIILITPAFTVIMALLKWGVVYYIYLRWFSGPKRKLLPFTQWRLPWYAIWGINLAVASYLIADISQWITLKNFGINLMLIYAAVGLLLGSAIFIKFLKSPKMSGFLRGLLIFMSIVYINITITALTLLGLFDLVFNFRKLPLKEDNKL